MLLRDQFVQFNDVQSCGSCAVCAVQNDSKNLLLLHASLRITQIKHPKYNCFQIIRYTILFFVTLHFPPFSLERYEKMSALVAFVCV